MSSLVTMLVGLPACGKSTLATDLRDKGAVRLNRDQAGGPINDLMFPFELSLQHGQDVVLDNTHVTPESRASFIQMAKKYKARIIAIYFDTSVEDCMVNALHRMWDRYGRIFHTMSETKGHRAAKDDNIFPPAAIKSMAKNLVPPDVSEGFDAVEVRVFVRRPFEGKKRALIMDVDGALRASCKTLNHSHHYPTHPSQVKALHPNIGRTLQRYIEDGWLLLGVSNQSGIASGHLTEEAARDCFAQTTAVLGLPADAIQYEWCSHKAFPVICWCRKPHPGLGVEAIRRYDLDPAQCIFVGDLGSDKKFTKACGFRFEAADSFWM